MPIVPFKVRGPVFGRIPPDAVFLFEEVIGLFFSGLRGLGYLPKSRRLSIWVCFILDTFLGFFSGPPVCYFEATVFRANAKVAAFRGAFRL